VQFILFPGINGEITIIRIPIIIVNIHTYLFIGFFIYAKPKNARGIKNKCLSPIKNSKKV